MVRASRWDPFGDMMRLQERINRAFDSALSQQTQREGEDLATGAWAPPVDIYETEDALILKAEIPEVTQKDIDLRVENSTLTVRGERKLNPAVKREHYHRVEGPYGPFARSFTLPNSVDMERISADYKDGILTVTMPKRLETRPKQISINVK